MPPTTLRGLAYFNAGKNAVLKFKSTDLLTPNSRSHLVSLLVTLHYTHYRGSRQSSGVLTILTQHRPAFRDSHSGQ
jgi:hypothetical protein